MGLIHALTDEEGTGTPVTGDALGRLSTRDGALGTTFPRNGVAPARTGGGNPTFTGYAIKDAEGFREFRLHPPKLPTDEYLVVAWSELEDDETALGLLLDAFCDEIESGIGTLKAGLQHSNIAICTLSGDEIIVTHDDPDERFKTILPVVVKLGSTSPTAAVYYQCQVTQ